MPGTCEAVPQDRPSASRPTLWVEYMTKDLMDRRQPTKQGTPPNEIRGVSQQLKYFIRPHLAQYNPIQSLSGQGNLLQLFQNRPSFEGLDAI